MPYLKVDLPFVKDYSLKMDGISQSIMSSWGCRQKLVLKLNRWTLINKSGTFFGIAFHDSFESFHNTKSVYNPKLFLKYLAESQRKEMKKVRSQQVMEKLSADYKLAAIVFPEYLAYYNKVDAPKKWYKLEAEFNYLWLNLYRLRGKIDGIYQDKKGRYWIIEHKTKSRIDEEVMGKALAFNFQNLFYIMACEREFGIKISGVLYDIIRKPGSKPHVGENDKDYATRLVKEINKDPKHYFKRLELFYSESDREIFRHELKCKLEELEDILEGTVPVYRNECLCERPFACEFLDACSSGTFAGLEQKETLFEELVGEEE